MQIQYFSKRLRAATLKTIEAANAIIEDYSSQGYKLTLRQIYYKLVTKNAIANNEKEYKRLGKIISDGRCCGLIDWAAIEDRTRKVNKPVIMESPAELVATTANILSIDLWANQPYRPEAWIEKDTLIGVLEVACENYQIPYCSCRGYTSVSAIHEAAMRLNEHVSSSQIPLILHLSDHDPSGIDMTRDIAERLELFCEREIEVRRLALTRNQIAQFSLPPNPAKEKDCRIKEYRKIHGNQSWELDALDPRTITNLIRDEIEPLLNKRRWRAAKKQQEKLRNQIRTVADRWTDVTEWLGV